MRDVLVTGASGGIGAAVASVLASSGHRVIAVGRDSDRLERLSSDGARVITADLARVGELRATVQEIGHLDALIHCAGVSAVASVADTDTTTWHDMLTVNVTAAAELTRVLRIVSVDGVDAGCTVMRSRRTAPVRVCRLMCGECGEYAACGRCCFCARGLSRSRLPELPYREARRRQILFGKERGS